MKLSSKTEIQSKLKALNIGCSAKYTDEVTHILIGRNPKELVDSNNIGLQLITENQFQKFFSENP